MMASLLGLLIVALIGLALAYVDAWAATLVQHIRTLTR
jgi:hypothetical protein